MENLKRFESSPNQSRLTAVFNEEDSEVVALISPKGHICRVASDLEAGDSFGIRTSDLHFRKNRWYVHRQAALRPAGNLELRLSRDSKGGWYVTSRHDELGLEHALDLKSVGDTSCSQKDLIPLFMLRMGGYQWEPKVVTKSRMKIVLSVLTCLLIMIGALYLHVTISRSLNQPGVISEVVKQQPPLPPARPEEIISGLEKQGWVRVDKTGTWSKYDSLESGRVALDLDTEKRTVSLYGKIDTSERFARWQQGLLAIGDLNSYQWKTDGVNVRGSAHRTDGSRAALEMGLGESGFVSRRAVEADFNSLEWSYQVEGGIAAGARVTPRPVKQEDSIFLIHTGGFTSQISPREYYQQSLKRIKALGIKTDYVAICYAHDEVKLNNAAEGFKVYLLRVED